MASNMVALEKGGTMIIASGGGYTVSGDDLGITNKNLKDVGKTGVNRAMGYGADSDEKSNKTVAGIGTSNITLSDNTAIDSIKTTRTTDHVLADTGLTNRFDKDAVSAKVNLQVGVTKTFDSTGQTVKKALNEKIATLKTMVESGEASQADLDNLQTVSLLVDGVASALHSPNSNGLLGDATQVVSPLAAKQIGDYFDDPAAKINFTQKQLDDIEAGRGKIDGFTWNHNAQSAPNNMQLVPEDIHNHLVPHTGQNSLKKGR